MHFFSLLGGSLPDTCNTQVFPKIEIISNSNTYGDGIVLDASFTGMHCIFRMLSESWCNIYMFNSDGAVKYLFISLQISGNFGASVQPVINTTLHVVFQLVTLLPLLEQ
jgi:hypothetical protein